MRDDTADIKVLTDELRRFGDQPLGVDTSRTTQYAAEAAGGGSQMTEAVQLQADHQAAAEKVLTFMNDVHQGMVGYRNGVRAIANVYDATEGEVLRTLNSVMPMDSGLPETAELVGNQGNDGGVKHASL
jgi:hypothetical protein